MDGQSRPQLEPVFPWVRRNLVRLAVYLAVAALVTAISMAASVEGTSFAGATVEDTTGAVPIIFGYLFFVGGVGSLPGMALWLVILARLPADRPAALRRVVAVVTAPLIGVVWLIVFLTNAAPGFGLVFGLLWPLGAGLVVSLRRPLPSRSEARS